MLFLLKMMCSMLSPYKLTGAGVLTLAKTGKAKRASRLVQLLVGDVGS